MPQAYIVNLVPPRTTGTPGRAENRARDRLLIIDEPVHAGGPGREITPAEAFLAGISACGVLLVESYAREAGLPVRGVEAEIQGLRDARDPSWFQRIHLRFHVAGATREQAEALVERYKGR